MDKTVFYKCTWNPHVNAQMQWIFNCRDKTICDKIILLLEMKIIVCVDCLLAMLNAVWMTSFYRMVMTYPRPVIWEVLLLTCFWMILSHMTLSCSCLLIKVSFLLFYASTGWWNKDEYNRLVCRDEWSSRLPALCNGHWLQNRRHNTSVTAAVRPVSGHAAVLATEALQFAASYGQFGRHLCEITFIYGF